MSRLKIFTFPDTILTQKANAVQRVEKEQRTLADSMLETMYYAPGIGLAANQVGVLSRLLVVDVDYELEDIEKDKPAEGHIVAGKRVTRKKPIVLINPRIILQEGTTTTEEGCLSVPDFQADVKRAEKIKVEYQDLDGLTKTLAADGILAVALQHEMDHLEGRLFIDRLSALKKEMVRKKLRADRVFRDEEDRMGVFDPGTEAASRRRKGF